MNSALGTVDQNARKSDTPNTIDIKMKEFFSELAHECLMAQNRYYNRFVVNFRVNS